MNHRRHPLYGAVVCGERARDTPLSFDTPVTCIRCAAWRAFPVPPIGEVLLRHEIERTVRAGDVIEIPHGSMDVLEDMTLVAVERRADGYYAVSNNGRRWPLDLPAWTNR